MVTALDERTALVLIDLQRAVVAAQTAHPMDGVLQKNAALVAAFRKAGLPIVIVKVDFAKAMQQQTRKDAKQASFGTLPPELLEITPEIETQPNDIFITKHTWGAFFETGLHDELQKHGVTGIVLGGVATSIGVEGTARQASELAYNITFAKDAMTDRIMDAHNHSIQIIFPRIGEVGETGDIITMLAAKG